MTDGKVVWEVILSQPYISSHQLRERLGLIASKYHWRQSKVIRFASLWRWLRHRLRAVVSQLRGCSSYASPTQSFLNGWTYYQFKSLWQSKPETFKLGPQQTSLQLNNSSSLFLIPGETISKTSLRPVDDEHLSTEAVNMWTAFPSDMPRAISKRTIDCNLRF